MAEQFYTFVKILELFLLFWRQTSRLRLAYVMLIYRRRRWQGNMEIISLITIVMKP